MPRQDKAAIDRLIHRAAILELNTESYRRRAAGTREGYRELSSSLLDPAP